MYKKLEPLSKTNHKDLKIDKISNFDFAKELKYAPIGLSEIAKLSCRFPVFITGGDENHFAVLLALGNQDNFFVDSDKSEMRYVPNFMRTYPLLVVNGKDENSEQVFRTVAIDVDSPFIGSDKEFALFEAGEASKIGNSLITACQQFDQDRLNANNLVEELKRYNLLDTRDIKLKVDEEKEITLLSQFFVVNYERLMELENEVLLDWTKKGWMFMIQSHINSISNVDLLLARER